MNCVEGGERERATFSSRSLGFKTSGEIVGDDVVLLAHRRGSVT